MTRAPRLEIRHVSKSFGGIRALRDVSLSVAPGSIHALLGENGAGKSTLVKIVTGVQPADAGTLLIDGAETRFASPMRAREAGVVAVYQDPRLFPHLDVAENIFMGAHPRNRFGLVARSRMLRDAQAHLDALGAEIDARRPVLGLSIGEAQFVEFARALAAGSIRLLFLDEPTASLTPVETDRLFRLVRRLRQEGAAIVFISHRLEEIEGFVDDVTILRDGGHALSAPAADLNEDGIVRAMVGREIASAVPRPPAAVTDAPALLKVDGLTAPGVFHDVDFSVRAGEVVGMAGLVGAGRSEVALALLGILKTSKGTVSVDGRRVERRSPRMMKDLGLAYVPEDRDHSGLVTTHSIAHNISLASLAEIAPAGVIARRGEAGLVADTIRSLQIKAGDPTDPVSTLSGGNRQKVVIGKWFARSPRVFILDEPTHGIDVGTKAHIHRLIADLAAGGAAVLVISSDLPEVLVVSHRILVMRNGRIVGRLAAGCAEAAVMALATGQTAPSDAPPPDLEGTA